MAPNDREEVCDQVGADVCEAGNRILQTLELDDLDLAERELAKVFALLDELTPDQEREGALNLRLGALRQRARVHRARGRTLKALLTIDEQLAIARREDLGIQVASGLNTRSTLLTDALELEAAEACLHEALEVLAGLGEAGEKVKSWVLGNLGVLQLLRYRFEEALARFDQLAEHLPDEEAAAFERTIRVNRAACLLGLGRYAEAREGLAPLLASDEGKTKGRSPDATVLSMHAECLAQLGSAAEATQGTLRAIELADADGAELTRIATRRSHGRAVLCLTPPDHAEAARMVAEALAIAETLGDAVLVLELRRELAGLQAQAGDSLEAVRDLRTGLRGDLTQGLEQLHALARAQERGPDDGRLHGELEQLRGQLDEQRFTLRSLVHDLRNPLTAILLGAEEQLLSGVTNDAFTELVRGQALRIRELVDTLLDLETLEAEGHPGEGPRVQLQDAIEPAIRTARTLAGRGSLELRGPLDLVVRGDRLALTRILDNLLANAIRYSPRPCEIELLVTPAGDQVRLEVLDRGPGLGGCDVEVLFQPFHRGEARHHGPRGGSGLGLTVARRLAGALGGSLVGLDREDGGACFRLELPLTTAR